MKKAPAHPALGAFACDGCRLARQQYLIDDMNHAFAGDDVGLNDGGIIDAHAMAAIDMDILALNGGDGEALADQLIGGHCTGHDMIGEDRHKLVAILGAQKCLNRAGGQGRKGGVGRC